MCIMRCCKSGVKHSWPSANSWLMICCAFIELFAASLMGRPLKMIFEFLRAVSFILLERRRCVYLASIGSFRLGPWVTPVG